MEGRQAHCGETSPGGYYWITIQVCKKLYTRATTAMRLSEARCTFHCEWEARIQVSRSLLVLRSRVLETTYPDGVSSVYSATLYTCTLLALDHFLETRPTRPSGRNRHQRRYRLKQKNSMGRAEDRKEWVRADCPQCRGNGYTGGDADQQVCDRCVGSGMLEQEVDFKYDGPRSIEEKAQILGITPQEFRDGGHSSGDETPTPTGLS